MEKREEERNGEMLLGEMLLADPGGLAMVEVSSEASIVGKHGLGNGGGEALPSSPFLPEASSASTSGSISEEEGIALNGSEGLVRGGKG